MTQRTLCPICKRRVPVVAPPDGCQPWIGRHTKPRKRAICPGWGLGVYEPMLHQAAAPDQAPVAMSHALSPVPA